MKFMCAFNNITSFLVLVIILCTMFSHSASAAPEFSIFTGEPFVDKCNIIENIYLTESEEMIYNSVWVSGADKYVAEKSSQVKIFEQEPGLLMGCRDATSWNRYSEIIPGNKTPVVTFAAKCGLRPESKGKSVYILIQEKLGDITTHGNHQATKQYYTVADWHKSTSLASKRKFDNYFVHGYSYTNLSCIRLLYGTKLDKPVIYNTSQ